jgi:hypothetical protein
MVLKMTNISTFTKHNLNEQGFGNLDDAAKSRYTWALRFTPGVSISLVAIGLVWQSPLYMGVLALIGLCGALFPQGMPIDLIYNFGVRHLFHAPPLPPTPNPRQFSYLISTLFLTGSALSFYYGLPGLGIILGGLVCLAGAVLTTSLWCLGSWFYKLIFGQQVVAPSSG